MGKLYQMVKTRRDSEAVYALFTRYGIDSPTPELESLFNHIKDWGPSRTLLCLGRFIIHKLDKEKRHGRAIYFIQQCQNVSPQFILADVSRTIFFAAMAIDAGKPEVAKNLLTKYEKRYGSLLNPDQCKLLLQKT